MPLGPFLINDAGNGIINLGGLPGIQQGLDADRPAAGVADGVWYLSIDKKKLYRWDLATTTWVQELSDGAGAAPDLEAVTTVGATTDVDTTFGDAGAQFQILGTTGFILLFVGGSLRGLWTPSDFVVFGDPGYFVEVYCSGTAHYLVFQDAGNRGRQTCAPLTADRLWTWPDADATAAVKLVAVFAGVNTATVYNIPHGLAFTPTSATITPKNAASALQLAGGYFLTYGAANITLTLLVATVGTPALNFDLLMYQ